MMILDHCKPSNLGDEPNIFSRGFRPRNPHGFEKYRFSMKNTGFGNTDYSFVFSEVGRSACTHSLKKTTWKFSPMGEFHL